MAAGRRLISLTKIDNYIPTGILCIHCQSEVDLTTAHYGRIIAGWQSRIAEGIIHTINNGQLHQIPTVTESHFPKKITGYCCNTCYTTLHNTTWRDKSDHLRRAFESVSLPVQQPQNDDHEASPIVKGLYAPHVVKGGKKGRKADYYETADRGDNGSPVIDNPPPDRKLQGFERPDRSDINLKPKRVIVKRGQWKVSPEKYNYKPPVKGASK